MKKLLTISLLFFSLLSFGQMRNDLSACKKYDLVHFNSAIDSAVYVCIGDVSAGDSYVRVYIYIASSTDTVDGEDVLAATGMFGVGRFIKTKTIILSTTGSSGAASYNATTGVLNIPSYSGEANTASNQGSGTGLFKQKSGVDLQFKSVIVSSDLTLTNNTNDITLSLPTRSVASATRSLVTTTSSTGFQLSSTKDYNVNYSVFAQVASALAGTNTADVYLEIAATNSTTPSDWTTISRSGISVAGVLSTSGNTQTVSGFIPKGYYVRIRTVATGANAGSAVFTYQVGQENSY